MPVLCLITLLFSLAMISSAPAQDASRPSNCIAVAETVPNVVYVDLDAVASEQEEVAITYAGHSTYIIETPAGVRIATDYSGAYGAASQPDIVTMNKAHASHYTPFPDPAIPHVLTGWNPEGDGPIEHSMQVEDVYIRNVTTDIRSDGGMEKDGNSIFIFEVAGLCIGHLGHLHHRLDESHYSAIGRLDVLMIPIDGGLTLSLDDMSEIAQRLSSSIILPMHRFSTPIAAFSARMGERFQVEFRNEPRIMVSRGMLPSQPTILILQGV